MLIINVLISLIAIVAAVAVPPIIGSKLGQDESQTKQDSSIPYCQLVELNVASSHKPWDCLHIW
ncbi:hypothetical protein GGR58DRAFT_497975 [Xylaria digitata]|nr:hypothetical protein GGR58DRAFT_497975 [Xylaria digitata]